VMPFEKIWEVPGFRETLVHHRPPDPPRNPDPPGKSTFRPSESARSRPPPDATHPDVTNPAAAHPAAAHPAAAHRTATADVIHPAVTHPAVNQPAATQPAATQPAATRPAAGHAGVSTVAGGAPLLVRHKF
jgi:hypothetical protein